MTKTYGKKNNYGKKDRGTHACFGIETPCLHVYACVCVHVHACESEYPNKQITLQCKNVELKRETVVFTEYLVFN